MFISKFLKKNPFPKFSKKAFSARSGPYNPYKYKDYFVPRTLPRVHSLPPSPIRNVRHVNPIRQSGPLPPYDGTYTMEDIRKVMWNATIGMDFCYMHQDVEEIMRRVPGITRKEAEWITKLGLSPDEQIDFAYIAYNLGLDVFYLANQVFVARQVVTNSKGEKVEIMWNSQAYEDLALLGVGFAPVMENVDYHWEIFLWGDPPLKVTTDMDLYNLPEEMRPYPSPRNPHSRKEYWKSQDDLEDFERMHDENWTPDSNTNVYEKKDFKKKTEKPKITGNINI